jgi:hypothetical protein
MLPDKQALIRHWVYAFFIACLFLLIRGYAFNDGDQSEHLPQVYQLLQPELYASDFFMQGHHQTFTMRYFYIQLVYGLSLFAPIAWVCFTLTLLCLTVTAWCWMKITAAFSDHETAIYIAPLLLFFLFYKFTVGGNHFQSNSFDCGCMATAFASAGILLFIKNRLAAAGFLLGLASLFQVLVGWQLFMLLGACLLFNFRTVKIRGILLFTITYLPVAAFILVPMLHKQFLNTEPYDKELYAQIMYFFRNPQHFIPSLFPWKDYVKYLVLFAVTLSILAVKPVKGKQLLLTLLLIQTAGLIVYTVGIEGFQLYDLAKFQWFKTTVWSAAFCCVVVSVFAAGLLPERVSNFRMPSWIFLSGSLASLFIVLNSAAIPVEKLQGRYKIGNYHKSDLTLMHEWIEANTPVNAVFLAGPDNESFGCEAKRSMPVNFKAIIHEPFFMFPWYERVQNLYHTTLENLDGLTAIQRAVVQYNSIPHDAAGIHIDYRLDNLHRCTFLHSLGREVYRNETYILTEAIKN